MTEDLLNTFVSYTLLGFSLGTGLWLFSFALRSTVVAFLTSIK